MDEQQKQSLKLDYNITSSIERRDLVQKIVESTPAEKLTNRYLQVMADYILFAMTKEEKRAKKINTDNRMLTINKRQVSFEGLVSKFENGQDGVYNLIIESNKNIILTPKLKITEKDVEEIKELQQLIDSIEVVKKQERKATGKKKFLLKKQLIEMYKDQYVIKNSYKQPVKCTNVIKSFRNIVFDDYITVLPGGVIQDKSFVSFFNPKHISALLANYDRLKDGCGGRFYTDGYYLIQDFQNLVIKTLKDKFPLYFYLVCYKIAGKQNLEIQELLDQQFHIRHSVEYISSLWKNKIPKLIADQAQKDYLEWYYTNKEKGHWKRCSKCGSIKLAHNKFFSKNSSSKDGFYSICKECRNKKTKEESKISKKPKIIKRIIMKPNGQRQIISIEKN